MHFRKKGTMPHFYWVLDFRHEGILMKRSSRGMFEFITSEIRIHNWRSHDSRWTDTSSEGRRHENRTQIIHPRETLDQMGRIEF